MPPSLVLDLVAADGPYEPLTKELMLYGQFVGSWDVEATWYDGEVVRRSKGECTSPGCWAGV